jgi:hypothetical protein
VRAGWKRPDGDNGLIVRDDFVNLSMDGLCVLPSGGFVFVLKSPYVYRCFQLDESV